MRIGRRRGVRRTFAFVSAITAIAVLASLVGTVAQSAFASSGPFVPTISTVQQEPHVICRAYGGSISANTEADQDLGFAMTYPDGVGQGDTFNIKIRPSVSLYPRDDRSTGITATINNIYNQVSGYQLPPSVQINSVTLGPINGNVEANAEAGYYVNRDNVPHSVVSGVGDIPDPNFDPMTLSPSLRLPIPGIAPNAYWNTSTNRVYTTLLGTGAGGSTQEYRGGSALQGPTVTINVTAIGDPGDDLQVTLAGQLPGSEPRNYFGAQPSNFPAPASSAAITSASAVAPWFSTNGTRYIYTDSVWPDPSYLNTVHTTALGGLITVQAKAACAPGWEPTSGSPSPPAYYVGPDAIPNGTSPPLSHTRIVPYIKAINPFNGAKYVTGQNVTVGYECWATPTETYDSCVGDQPTGQLLNTTGAPGSYTFTIDATDAYADPLTKVVSYDVVDNQPPIANAGPNQTNKVAGNTITLDASGSSDPDGPPPQLLSYHWEQVLNGAPLVMLTPNADVQKPTFVVPPVDNPGGYSFQFTVTVDDGYGGVTTSSPVTIGAVASTPTVVLTKVRTDSASQSTFFTGDKIRLDAAITNPDGNNEADYTFSWTQASGIATTLSPSNTAAHPTYILPANGTSACASGTGATNCPRFTVVVTKANTNKSSVAVTLANYGSSLAARPVANAGAAQNIANSGGTVSLNGTASTQAQGHPISYAWTQTGGPALGPITDANTATASVNIPAGGASPVVYTFSLTVQDTQNPIAGTGTNGNTSLPATTTVTVVPDHVVASSGANQTGKVAGNVVTLDASASTEPNLAPLNYSWTQVANGAPTVTLTGGNTATPTFTVPPVTNPVGYTFAFTVTATSSVNPLDTDTSPQVTVTAVPSTPTVTVTKFRTDSAPQTTFFAGDTVRLDANITNPDGNTDAEYTYSWTQASGISTPLSSNTAAHPTYTLPTNGSSACASGTGSTNCPRYSVVVTKINTSKVSASASLANYGSSLASRPVADAGPAQNVNLGHLVTLDGSASSQAQGHALTYAWTQTGGPSVTLNNPTSVNPTFTSPVFPTSLSFQLVVTDPKNPIAGTGTNGKTSLPSSVSISSGNLPPTADAGPDQYDITPGDTVYLDGTGSYDVDPGQTENLIYAWDWEVISDPSVVLVDADTPNPYFIAPIGPTVVTVKLTVTDEYGASDVSYVSIHVTGIPGYDVSTSTKGILRAQRNFSVFLARASNIEQGRRNVSQEDVDVTILVNGVPRPQSEIALGVFAKGLRPGKGVTFPVTWTHGDTLQAGDQVVVTVCTRLFGDEHPENDCGTKSYPESPLELTVGAFTKIGHSAKTTRVKITVNNQGLSTATPVRTEYLSVSAQVGSDAPVNLPLSKPRVALKAGKSKNYPFTWNHAPLPAGTQVTINACISVANNTADPEDTCTEFVTTVL
jgi:hypothetical protein